MPQVCQDRRHGCFLGYLPKQRDAIFIPLLLHERQGLFDFLLNLGRQGLAGFLAVLAFNDGDLLEVQVVRIPADVDAF